MAVSAAHYTIIRHLFLAGLAPQNGGLLELGEANWYGDVAPLAMLQDIKMFITDPARRDALSQRLTSLVADGGCYDDFEITKVFYAIFFSPSEQQAVDPEGTSTAHRFDLNSPITLNRRFDVVFNHGTAEHIFNVGQFLETMHQYTAPQGLMIHESQFRGWVDHGFYNLQPALFFKLAEENRYRLVLMVAADIGSRRMHRIRGLADIDRLASSGALPENASLFTVLAKGDDERPFQSSLGN